MKSKKGDLSGLIFVGFLMLGLGVGMLLGQTAAGVLIELCVGFIAMFIARNRRK